MDLSEQCGHMGSRHASYSQSVSQETSYYENVCHGPHSFWANWATTAYFHYLTILFTNNHVT